MDQITGVRWGVFKKYTNGIKTSTSYAIWVGRPEYALKIECATPLELEGIYAKRYELILEKLWKAVCVRLISDTLRRLSIGDKIPFGDIIVDRNGILLKKRQFFKSEPFYSEWEDLRIANGAGFFSITSERERKAYVNLYYRDVDNVHILETILRFLWKDGNHQKLRRGEFC